MPERMDQVSAVTTAADDRQRIGQRRAKAQPLPAHRSEIGEHLACAALEKGDSRGIDGRNEAAQFDCSRDPQPADHRREVEAKINRADRPFDEWNIHVEFDVIAALGVERDFVADLSGRGRDQAPAERTTVCASTKRSPQVSLISPSLCGSSRSTRGR